MLCLIIYSVLDGDRDAIEFSDARHESRLFLEEVCLYGTSEFDRVRFVSFRQDISSASAHVDPSEIFSHLPKF